MPKWHIATITIVLLGFAMPSYATASLSEDSAMIEEIAKREKVSPAEVEKSLKEGCDSGATFEMAKCGYYHQVGEDIKLNYAYQALLKKLANTAAQSKLVKAQRAWLLFRDATCEYESDGMSGGTGRHVLYNGCLATMHHERTLKLNEYLKCDLSDAGCPGFN